MGGKNKVILQTKTGAGCLSVWGQMLGTNHHTQSRYTYAAPVPKVTGGLGAPFRSYENKGPHFLPGTGRKRRNCPDRVCPLPSGALSSAYSLHPSSGSLLMNGAEKNTSTPMTSHFASQDHVAQLLGTDLGIGLPYVAGCTRSEALTENDLDLLDAAGFAAAVRP